MLEKESMTHKIEDDMNIRNKNWDIIDKHLESYEVQHKQDTLKIASLERELNEYKKNTAALNINREPKQKVSGYSCVDMPKSVSNGQVGGSIKGDTIINHAGLSGKGFNSPAEDILMNQGTIEDGTLELVSDGQNFKNFRISANLKEGVTYTYMVEVIENTLDSIFALLQTNNSGSVKYLKPNETGLIKFTFEAGKEDEQAKLDMITLYLDKLNSVGTKIKFKNLMILEGDYTNREVNYIEGTKSVPASFRVKSVGKNLFDGEWWNGYNDIIKPTPNAISFTNLIRGEKNESYRFSYEFVDNTGIVMTRTYDSNKKMIRSFVSNLVTLQGSEVYFEFHIYNTSGISPTNIKNAQVEKGREVTEYEPYKEDIAYITAKENNKIVNLMSHEGVHDEIDLDKRELIKRIGVDEEGLTYQLAEPEIIPINISGSIIGNPSGTVYVEPAIPDAGIYQDGLPILEQELSIDYISKLSKVDYITGFETNLDTSKVTLSTDKKSFTHPDLQNGDMVFFEYYYKSDYADGELVVEYYDSRYVIKDKTTGTLYEWNVEVDNGVPNISLKEV